MGPAGRDLDHQRSERAYRQRLHHGRQDRHICRVVIATVDGHVSGAAAECVGLVLDRGEATRLVERSNQAAALITAFGAKGCDLRAGLAKYLDVHPESAVRFERSAVPASQWQVMFDSSRAHECVVDSASSDAQRRECVEQSVGGVCAQETRCREVARQQLSRSYGGQSQRRR